MSRMTFAEGVSGRNPHDIGRRILLSKEELKKEKDEVAILMTLEGEYYKEMAEIQKNYFGVAILMTLEGEYYKTPVITTGVLFKSQSS